MLQQTLKRPTENTAAISWQFRAAWTSETLQHALSCYLPLLLQPGVLLHMLQSGADSTVQSLLVLNLLLLQSGVNVDLLSDSLLGQLSVQLVDAAVGVGNQGVQIIRRQFTSSHTNTQIKLIKCASLGLHLQAIRSMSSEFLETSK